MNQVLLKTVKKPIPQSLGDSKSPKVPVVPLISLEYHSGLKQQELVCTVRINQQRLHR